MEDKNLGSIAKISEVLNTTFEMEEVKVIDSEIAQYESKRQLIDPSKMVLEDQEELRDGLKRIIYLTESVMNKLNDDIMIGSRSNLHMTMSQLTYSIVTAYKELRELNQFIFDAKFKMNPNGSVDGMKSTDKIELTSEQLLDMMDTARKNSSLNEIKVDFKVEDEI